MQQEEFTYRYIIGIDLGTTNSAVAYVDLADETVIDAPDADQEQPSQRSIQTLRIPQLVAAGEVAERPVLPSFLYLPGQYDLAPGSTALPWDSERDYAVGEFAREQGANVPDRGVASAKSWLSYAAVDRTAAILPWGAPPEENGGVDKVSPVEASARYLRHIREAWNAQMVVEAGEDEDEDAALYDSDQLDDLTAEDLATLEERARAYKGYFDEQLVVLTVPASFDEAARELTLTAAREAGIAKAVLLEEPQAAFYAWLSRHEADWQKRMAAGQLILVCDVGGGTTDFTMIAVREGTTGLRFDRLAVGDHLMLGGDNMDLTLGRLMEAKLMGQPGKLDARRWPQLVYQCRRAKEQLLNRTKKQDAVDITLVGEAGKLIGGTLKSTLNQSEIQQVILDGFFPESALADLPNQARRSGLTELGLPYVQDAAITRHMAQFWTRFEQLLQDETGRDQLFPDYILYNGGTLAPTIIRERLTRVVGNWFEPQAGDDWQPIELENPQPELAVALGAAYYGLVRIGKGVRVGSGSPRAYYIGVGNEKKVDSVKVDGVMAGAPATSGLNNAICLVPRGTEEGYELRLSELGFEALTNQPVSFQVYSSSTRLGDQLGETVELSDDEVTTLPPIQTVLRYGRKGTTDRLPVQLGVQLTEVGTLALWCYSQKSEHRWQLQFDVRQMDANQGAEPSSGPVVEETIDHATIETAQMLIAQTFSREHKGEHNPAHLRRKLEDMFELPKEEWPTSLIRQLADALLEATADRAMTADHEARWLNLLGFCLRPGFGDPVDEWRMKRVWQLYFQGLQHPKQTQNRTEWWIFWRRVAGGMKAGHQADFYNHIRSYVMAGGSKRRKKSPSPYPKSLNDAELSEIWLALANFEWLPTDTKVDLGRTLLQNGQQRGYRLQELWALSRFGARTPAYGPIDRLIPGAEASAWLETILKMPLQQADGVAQVLVMLARYTGDRVRDVPEENRRRVEEWLAQHPKSDRFKSLLLDGDIDMDKEEKERMFGDSLPEGLVVIN